jgi:hypothetical protein
MATVDMTTDATIESVRYDRTLRIVMWNDAFLSIALVVAGVLASPLVAVLGLPHAVVLTVGLVTIGVAVLLAAFGAITGVLIMLRMHAGHYLLPTRLRLPLPAVMRPPTGP